jgi:ornithine carbamoyltransferase
MPPDNLPAAVSSDATQPKDTAAALLCERLPLNSRNIGVLCDDLQRAEAHLLQQTATGLGARVALVRCNLDSASGPAELSDTARVLGRLYDAVLCLNLAPSIVSSLREAAGVPVIAYDVGEWLAQPPTRSDAAARARALLLAHLAVL